MSTRRQELELNLAAVRDEIAPYDPTLIVVTKTYPVSDVEILHNCGVRDFGENRSDEGSVKAGAISAQWHYQGEIQSKKLRSILSWADVIHSLDDLRHGQKIQEILLETDSTVELFIQLSLDADPARGGVAREQIFELADQIGQMSQIKLVGLMCVPPVNLNPAEAFAEISAIHQDFSRRFPDSNALSAGMSGDYLIALEHGATHIRVGSKILGPREYPQ